LPASTSAAPTVVPIANEKNINSPDINRLGFTDSPFEVWFDSQANSDPITRKSSALQLL
jgi:hypothetical protein